MAGIKVTKTYKLTKLTEQDMYILTHALQKHQEYLRPSMSDTDDHTQFFNQVSALLDLVREGLSK